MVAILLLVVTLQATPAQPPTPKPRPTETETYQKVDPANVDLQSAVKFAFSEQRRKANEPVSLVRIVTAEKAIVAPNFRVCLFADRNGVTERAQVVVSRDQKKKTWDLTVWAWGSCR